MNHFSTRGARAGDNQPDTAYGTDGKVNVTVTMPVELRDAMQQIADRNDRTLSGEIRRLFRAHAEANGLEVAA